MNPCQRHGCTACCSYMNVPLLQDDIDRILRYVKPPGQFYRTEGSLKLLIRHQDKCIFMYSRKGCGIHPFHPIWCKLYPLTYNPATARIEVDQRCSFNGEFHTSTAIDEATVDFLRWLAQQMREEERAVPRMPPVARKL